MEIKLFTGSAHPDLARRVAEALGVPLGKAVVDRFPDGEVRVRLLESVRGDDVYLIQPTSPPVNDHLMELLLLADAARRSSAGRINAVIPYFGYARQDKQTQGREPVSAKLVANLLETVGVHRVIAIDLHAPQIQGFFDIPVDHLSAVRLFARYLQEKGYTENGVVVSPDAGRAEEARRLSERLGLPFAMLAKRRHGPKETSVTYVIGEVVGKRPLIIDDIVSTGGTIRRGVEALLLAGALPEMVVMATHPVLVGEARENLSHPAIREVIFTDTIPLRDGGYTVLSTAELLAQAIRHVHTNQSVSALI
ncbi:ribose-phosphate diphosphokinase [Thermus scotoductus]|uniref:Ribose-phosphate pyrophosphokinase n=1 Tax=Thermus scotoductus TaxID=37636 RepID=A0A430R352_THESC|nr:ribose-phosphate pyrophosphokinase [Thermus scotoductus]RTG94550.1 phosphoribosylpyrophosphate synthetase [Thermus scotoductus]RTH01773.1 phosphoribosylpyrophosphate synthetase [Thermus scotoductus]RTH23596.1 phosphoribosylpyrophosphate synthetase [Thermus scotoductus]RTH99089.1 phosphoribosylpyrophosphate synthetase [Thermus scotoductus]RTI20956.1 phosphoribosylpyrophosphate synthetase [Thermus scotoductus]